MLQGKGVKDSENLFVNAGDLEQTEKWNQRLNVLRTHNKIKTNDISMYFKRITTVFLAAHTSVSILNCDNLSQNLITKAINMSLNQESIKHYFSGMVVHANRHKIKSFVEVQSTASLSTINHTDRLWSWLTKTRYLSGQLNLRKVVISISGSYWIRMMYTSIKKWRG